MKTLVPNYYKKFRCIADKCRHNCCVGWEIDIDDDTLGYYADLDGDFGKKVRQNIDFDDECPHFILKEGDRCPFLAPDGLCEIIKRLGEDALCDICTDHPRFRNFFSEHTEMGLGLCCEEASRIILSSDEPFELVPTDEDFAVCLDDLEKEMLDKINALGIGPQGFGGRTTAIGLNIETLPTHIAGMPCAININCHVTRHKSEVL